jgi:hypothetical protein
MRAMRAAKRFCRLTRCLSRSSLSCCAAFCRASHSGERMSPLGVMDGALAVGADVDAPRSWVMRATLVEGHMRGDFVRGAMEQLTDLGGHLRKRRK